MNNFSEFSIIKYLFKVLGRNITKNCANCNDNRFDLIINNILGLRNNLCFNCRLRAIIFKQLIFRWFNHYDVEDETILNFFEDTTMRKVIKNFFKGLALFGLQKPFITGAPLSVVWNFTKKCNLRCSHCFSDSKFDQKSKNELTTDEALRVIDILAANDVVTVNFCGGEPLTREDLFEVMKYAHDNNIYPSISTNATLLSSEACQKLYDAGVRGITISLDSISSKNHDLLRGVPGAFEMAVDGFKNAIKFGKFEEIIINTTLLDYNYNEIPQIYEFAEELGATGFYVSRILPCGRAKKYHKHNISNEILIKVMNFMAGEFIKNVQNKKKISVLGRGMPYYGRACREQSNGNIYPVCEVLTGYEAKYESLFNNKAAEVINRLTPYFGGCATGLFYCGLDCEGNILPCAPADNIKLGNILENGLSEVWVKSPILNQIRNRKKITGKCSKCGEKSYCGGCRLTAYGLTGDWLESDLSCPY